MSILIRPTLSGRYILRIGGEDVLDCATFDACLTYLWRLPT